MAKQAKDKYEGKTTYTHERCAELFTHCQCHYVLTKNGQEVASCTSLATFIAVKRLCEVP